MPPLWLGRAKFSTLDHESSLVAALAFLGLLVIVVAWCVRLASTISSKSREDADLSVRQTKKVHYVLGALLFMLAVELPVLLSTPREGLADLILGTDPRLAEVLARVPDLRRGPAPPLLLRNRHVAFLPWLIQNEVHRRRGIPFHRIDVEVRDCEEKAEGCRPSDAMNDTIALDVFPSFGESPHGRGFNRSSPIILYAPGLRCSSQDMPGNSIIRKAYGAGFRSIVVNRRGLIHALKRPRVNLFGDVEDMKQVYLFIRRELVTPDTPFFLYGISAGTAVSVTALAKWDRQRTERTDPDIPVFVASVDVVPGYDISKVMTHERFLWPYNHVLMQGVLDHFVRRNEGLLREHDGAAVDAMLGAASLQDVVDAGAVFAGYPDAASYYEDVNPIHNLRDIATPKLVLNAADDPCCNIDNLYEHSPYPRHQGKSYAEMIRETARGLVAVTYTGSHAPFVCARDRWAPFTRDPLTGGWMLNSWADQVTIKYYQAALEVYGDRRFLWNTI